jgi:hypothetical protein
MFVGIWIDMLTKIAGSAVGILLLSIAVLSCAVRAGNIVLIPEGFVGWVRIQYEVQQAPSLPKEGVKYLIHIPSSGSLMTSSARQHGYGIDRYYFMTDSRRTPIPAEDQGCASDQPCVQQFTFFTSPVSETVFFVGRHADLARYPKPFVSGDESRPK